MGSKKVVVLGLLILIFSSFPVVSENHDVEAPSILVAWGYEGEQGYVFVFDDNAQYEIDINFSINSDSSFVYPEYNIEWQSIDNQMHAFLTTSSTLNWSDVVQIDVHVVSKNDIAIDPPVEASRMFNVGIWNQPIDDHEITLSTTWSMQQNYSDEYGPQVFELIFEGQGWQERVGQTLQSWELGSGELWSIENTAYDSTTLDLNFSSIWKNETTVNGTLTSQVFEANGDGSIWFLNNESGLETEVFANVTSAYLKRELNDEQIDEYLRLEALGTLGVYQLDNESELNIDGEISVFVLEYLDEGGQRTMQHNQIEAMADFVLIDDGARLDVELNKFIAIERWVDGVRVLHLEEIQGDGTFGLEDEDENASLVLNGTIFDLHQKNINGTTTIDDLHVDGTLSGDVEGTFGIVRGIEAVRNQSNATGEFFLVNVIHQETWFNLTGIGGGSWFGSSEIGQVYNNTYEFQVLQSDWDNRTVRLKWDETGPDPSSGDEYPERSPIQKDPVEPEPAEGLGNLSVQRETGLMPIPLTPGDSFVLDGQSEAVLHVNVNAIRGETWDTHNVSVIDWNGTYGDGASVDGFAHGSIIVEGPLNGLLVNTTREFYSSENNSESNVFTETQALDKIISPSIVGSDRNTPPIIGSVQLREGLVLGEGGSIAHLEVEVNDLTWNLRQVTADLSSLGLGTVLLNDRGLDGDEKIGDNVFTTTIVVKGLETGDMLVEILATDSFGATDNDQEAILIQNQGPRMIDVEILPTSLERGQSAVMNVVAYDGHGVENVTLDLRALGGDLIPFAASGAMWTAMVEMPFSMSPGEQTLTFILNDEFGAQSIVSVWYPLGLSESENNGPHAVNTSKEEPIFITINNEPPYINATTVNIEKQTDEPIILEIGIFDPDGISTVMIELGVFTPLGANELTPMYDDGLRGGDKIAGDGIYTVELSVRDATPLGTFEMMIYSTDVYGSQISNSAFVVLEEAQDNANQSESNPIAIIFGLVAFLAVLVLLFLFVKGRNGESSFSDRFGEH